MSIVELVFGFVTCGLLFALVAEVTKLRISLERLANTQHRLLNHHRDESDRWANQDYANLMMFPPDSSDN